MKNTKEKGNFQIFTFYDEKEKEYVAVCLEFDIIATIEDLKQVRPLMQRVFEMSERHFQWVIENNLSDKLLNRHAHKKYWDKFKSIQEKGPDDRKGEFVLEQSYPYDYPINKLQEGGL